MIRKPGRNESRTDDPHGSDLLLRIAKTPERTRRKRLERISCGLLASIRADASLPKMPDFDLKQAYGIQNAVVAAVSGGHIQLTRIGAAVRVAPW